VTDPRLDRALADLVEAARATGAWKAQPGGKAIGELTDLLAAEGNARIAIRLLFKECVVLREVGLDGTPILAPQAGPR
jgi:hypothetical protein